MKKSIVLLITILFIATVSLLILKNLDDADSYISKQNSKFTKAQIIFFINNAKEQIKPILTNKDIDRETLKEYVGMDFPIVIEDAKITIRLEEYDKYNINLLKESKDKNKDEEKYKYLKEYLIANDIYDIELLKEIYNGNNKIENTKQLKSMFEKFEKETNNDRIEKIKDYIGFQDYDKKEFTLYDKEKEIKFYELFIKVEYLKEFVKAYYILDRSGGEKYFEYSFK